MRRSEPILGVALLAALAVVQEGHPTTHGHGVGSPRHHPWELPPGSRYTLKDLKRATAGVFPGRMASVARMSWRRLAETLDAGERAVTVAGLGSSVLGAHGGCTEALPALKPLCGNCCTPTGGQPPPQMTGIVAAPGAGWARIGFDWLNYTWPNASHRFLNSARAGGGPEVYADCMNKAAPQVKEADLVVLEFGITGSTLPANTERVIRQLLAMKPTPAIIMVNFVEWCRGNGVMELCSGEEGREANISLVPLRDRVVAPHMTLTGLAAHYDIPAVSMVELVWPSYFPGASLADAKTPPGTMLEDPAAFVAAPPAELSAKEHLKKHYSDGTHPTELGNSLAGAAFAYALQLALQKKATGHHSVSTRTAKDPPLPWPSLLPPTRVSASVCYDFFNATGPSAISSVPGYMMAELLAEWPPVVASSGFQYEEMVPNLQGDMRFKPGFVAYEPGSFVELVLDLDGLVNEERHQMEEEREEGGNQGAGQMEAGQARASDTYTLNLVYLISYEHMGKALVTCSEGCACSGAAPINAHTKVHHSVTANQIISLWRNVAPEGSHQMCQIQIKVVKETDSGEHKFKLVTVVLQKHVRLNAAAGRKKRLYRAKRRSRQEA